MRNFLSRRNNDLGFNFFDDAFEDFFKPVFYGVKESAMKTDIKKVDGGFELKIDMPGFEKSDINLTLDKGYLKVEAKREEKEEDEKRYKIIVPEDSEITHIGDIHGAFDLIKDIEITKSNQILIFHFLNKELVLDY